MSDEFRLEFKKDGLRLTDKFYKFRRVKNSVLRKAEEEMEKMRKGVDEYLQEQQEKADELNDKISEKNDAERVLKKYDSILDNPKKARKNGIENPIEIMKLYDAKSKEYTQLLKETRKLERELRDFDEKNKSSMNKAVDAYYLSVAKLAEQTLVGIDNVDEFADNMQSIDRLIVQDIGSIVPQCQAGNGDKVLKNFQKQLEKNLEERDTSFL